MNEPDQQKVVDLDRGLFLISYKSADDDTGPPRVAIAALPGHERRMEFILHPDAAEPVLWEPNSALVVRVNSPGKLQVQVLPMRPGGSKAAVIGVEPIQFGRPTNTPQGMGAFARSSPSPLLGDLKLMGHVAGIGDVVVGSNTWIAGPSAPSRIEGIAVEWPGKPPGVDFRYAVQFANAQPGSGKVVPLGAYAGTRGRALPLTGVVLEIAGAEDLEVTAEAIFLSAPTLQAVGKRVVLSGPTGREPLVGLRVKIERVGTAAEEPARPSKPVGMTPASGRVRVFRSRPKQESAAG